MKIYVFENLILLSSLLDSTRLNLQFEWQRHGRATFLNQLHLRRLQKVHTSTHKHTSICISIYKCIHMHIHTYMLMFASTCICLMSVIPHFNAIDQLLRFLPFTLWQRGHIRSNKNNNTRPTRVIIWDISSSRKSRKPKISNVQVDFRFSMCCF